MMMAMSAISPPTAVTEAKGKWWLDVYGSRMNINRCGSDIDGGRFIVCHLAINRRRPIYRATAQY